MRLKLSWPAMQRHANRLIDAAPVPRWPARRDHRQNGQLPGGASPTDFVHYDLEDFVLSFHIGALQDVRGVGRATRGLMSEMDRSAPRIDRPDRRDRMIHFYPSIHWVPDDLPRPNLVMLHDVTPLLCPQVFPRSVYREWNTVYRARALKAQHILTVSRSSADSIAAILGTDRERIHVNHNGVTRCQPAMDDPVPLPEGLFFVMLGPGDYHKNFDVVARSFEDPRLADVALVLVGDTVRLQAQFSDHPARDRFHFVGHVSDSTAAEILRRAHALVFPSLREGFGLPPFEAGLQRTPSICSRRPAMDELLEGKCIFAPHDDPDRWTEAMLDMIRSPSLRSELGQKIHDHAELFTWQAAAHRLVSLCRSLAARPEEQGHAGSALFRPLSSGGLRRGWPFRARRASRPGPS